MLPKRLGVVKVLHKQLIILAFSVGRWIKGNICCHQRDLCILGNITKVICRKITLTFSLQNSDWVRALKLSILTKRGNDHIEGGVLSIWEQQYHVRVMVLQITSDFNQVNNKHQNSSLLALCYKKDQQCGKSFHAKTSPCIERELINPSDSVLLL